MKAKWQTFNDGVLALARDKAKVGTFAERLNVDELDDLDIYEHVHYGTMSIRTEDVDFAEQTGISLSMKVRIRNVAACKPGDKAVIGSDLYNIGSLDRSADRTIAYLYLEHMREVS